MSGTLRIVETNLLSIACEIAGPENGKPAMLLHGWPDDARTWDRILPALHATGLRTVVPFLRGFGPTQFRASTTMRSGQIVALAQDALELADALGLERFALVGHDWGARVAYVMASQWPDRLTHAIAMSVPYGPSGPQQEMSLEQARAFWYQWYMVLDRGADLVRKQGKTLAKFTWTTWSPPWQFSDAEFDATARSFENPDWAEVTVHSYRVRWGAAEKDPRYAGLDRLMQSTPKIAVPALVMHGRDDDCTLASSFERKDQYFSRRYERLVLEGVGHFPQREAPDRVAQAILQFIKPD